MKTLKNRLTKGLAPIYYISGDDYFLYEKALSMIKKTANITLDDFNFLTFDDDNFSISKLIDACRILPMGDSKKLVLLKNLSKIVDTDKKQLEKYVINPEECTVLVIFDFYNKLSFIKSKCEIVDAKRMESTLAKSIVLNEITKRGKQISGEALNVLYEYTNGYLTRLMNELDKLIYYDLNEEMINKKTVENLVHKDNDFVVFELTEALGKRMADRAVSLASMMAKEPSAVSLITNHFRRLFFISTSNLSDLNLATLLGVKEYAIIKQRESAKNFSKMQLKKIYSLLEETDYKIKSGQMLSENAFYYLVFSILYI